MAETMQAIVIPRFGGPSVLEIQHVPKPIPDPSEALIHVRAFGINHAEMHMRKGEWDEWNPLSGLECVGTIAACPSGAISEGTKVVGVMGGMGRSRPGSYGEFVTIPLENVIPIKTDLPWEQLAALPEVYCTAWPALFLVLDVQAGEKVLIRGATSTVGQAAVHLAVDKGAEVTATTRREGRFDMLRGMGAVEVVKEQENLKSQFEEGRKFDKILNLIGNRVLVESIGLTKVGGRMLQAGWLGGLEPVKDFNPMVEMESGVHFSLYHSKVLSTPGFELDRIPFQEIVSKIESGKWDAKPTYVFAYDEIHKAHEMLDSHDAGGKIVVKH
jgi:NADPH2:quinone reductase